MPKGFIIFFFLCVSIFTYGQDVRFEQISTAEGLSQSNVTCLTHDRHGYLWIGTNDGLNRYDGYEFKIFEHDPAKQHSLPSSSIRSIYKSKDGTLWIGTVGGGICRYDQDIDGFVTYKHVSGETQSLSDNMILSISEDIYGNIWAGSEKGGLNRLSFRGNQGEPTITSFRKTEEDGSINHNYVHSICNSSNGDLIIGTWGGINILKKEDLDKGVSDKVIFESIRAESLPGLSSNAVRSIVESNVVGEFWVGTWGGGINRLVRHDNQYEIDNSFSRNLADATSGYRYIANIYKDLNGIIWIGSFERGLTRYDPSTNETSQYTNDDISHSYISSNFVSGFATDSVGITWAGTYGGGLNKYDGVEQPFKLFQQSNKADYPLSNNLIFAIQEDSDRDLWVGTHGGGLNRLEKNADGYSLSEVYRVGTIPSDIIISLGSDRQDRIWIGSREGLSIYNPNEDTFELIPDEPGSPHGLWGNFVWAIHQDAEGAMWIGGRRGLNQWDPETNRFIHYNHNRGEPGSLSSNNIYSIFKDSRSYLWVGTPDGLNLSVDHNQSSDFIKYHHDVSDRQSIAGNTIYVVEEDRSGNIWIGTNEGLSCIEFTFLENPQQEFRFTNFTTADGLIDNLIYGILIDDGGGVWLSSNEGLSHFDPDQLLMSKEPQSVIYNYDQSDGLQSNEFNMGAFYKNGSGRLFFGGNNGMTAFSPDELIRNEVVPPVAITSITINNESVPVPSDGYLNLTWQDHALTLEYAALNFRKNTKNEYVYRMSGVDGEKVYAGNRRYVNYTNLNPGSYQFRVEGSNNDDVWNHEGATLNIHVLPPPWRTWWAYGLYLFLISGSLVTYERYRSREAKRRLETKIQIEKAKLAERERVRKKSSQDFHDELGNRLTKVSLLTGLLKSKIQDVDTLKIINRVEENTQLISSGLRDFVWILDSTKGTLMDLVERLTQFGNDLYEHSEITFYTRHEKDIEWQRPLGIDLRRHIVLLFKEAMNNTLKYADADTATFSVGQLEDALLFTFTDNGVGFELSSHQVGYGLKNMASRASELKGKLDIQSCKGRGTSITLMIDRKYLS